MHTAQPTTARRRGTTNFRGSSEPTSVDEIVISLREQRRCDVTITNYRRDGSPFTNLLTLRPVLDALAGRMRFVVGTLREASRGSFF